MMTPTKEMPDGYFVVDLFPSSLAKTLVSGPWHSVEEAERDRREWNVADDLVVVEFCDGHFHGVQPTER